jgi:hypothetical protein
MVLKSRLSTFDKLSSFDKTALLGRASAKKMGLNGTFVKESIKTPVSDMSKSLKEFMMFAVRSADDYAKKARAGDSPSDIIKKSQEIINAAVDAREDVDVKRSVLIELFAMNAKSVALGYGEMMVRFLPSSSENFSRGKDLYQHSGHYNTVMTVAEYVSIVGSRAHCACSGEVLYDS